MRLPPCPRWTLVASLPLVLGAVAGCSDDDDTPTPLPQLSAATPSSYTGSCTDLRTRLSYANTNFVSATTVAAGPVTSGGPAVGEHCLVTGNMFQRTNTNAAIPGATLAIGFEMRLPRAWNGRFFYQANGGTDGAVSSAVGAFGGGPLTNALAQGFAVISSDAGHSNVVNNNASIPFATSLFGLDNQARLDYGYQAVGKLTPMAKALIAAVYGRGPDRSYIGGCSNGGRHTFIAAARYADQYDGYLAGAPGYRLPRAAIANIYNYQRFLSVASTAGDASSGFTAAERALVSNAVLARCDALDGATDGMVQDTAACQGAFSLDRDVPTCTGARNGSCLSADQKTAIGRVFSGAVTGTGAAIYSPFYYDTGFATNGWGPAWKFGAPPTRDGPAVGFIWAVPPENPATFNGAAFAAGGNIDDMVARVQATSAAYPEPALSFMVPPNEGTDLSTLKNRGAKMLVYHGVSDPIFSDADTVSWYQRVQAANGGDASNFARFYPVPGMNHCSGGPATDQFDMITPLVNWVEKGEAPGAVVASARGTGNAGGVNTDGLPATWSAARTRPLCPYPQVARYKGSGSVEDAANFACQ